jgi:hypothetical protein
LYTETFPAGEKYYIRQPLMACLFHGISPTSVLEEMPSLRTQQQTLKRALRFDYNWHTHPIFEMHNDPDTKKPKVTMKEVNTRT